jgi:hypothetical protein
MAQHRYILLMTILSSLVNLSRQNPTLFVDHPLVGQHTGIHTKLQIRLCVSKTTTMQQMDNIYQLGQLGIFTSTSSGEDAILMNQLDIKSNAEWSIMDAWKQRISTFSDTQTTTAAEEEMVAFSAVAAAASAQCFFQYYFKVDIAFPNPGIKTLLVAIYEKGSIKNQSNKGIKLLFPHAIVSWITEALVKNAVVGTSQFRQQYFEQVYAHCTWQINNLTSCSGWSTTILTQHTQQTLREVLLQFGIKHFLDAPCGDMEYMAKFMEELWHTKEGVDIIHYGADIVPSLIHQHKGVYAHQKWSGSFQSIDFANANLGKAQLMRGNGKPYDLIFSRQMTQHLSTKETCAVLRTFNRSGARYLLATTSLDGDNGFNGGLVWQSMSLKELGNVHRQNLLRPPFNLPTPLYMGRDDPYDMILYLGLWKLPLIGNVCSGIPYD